MADQEHHVAALLERAQFFMDRLRPILPAALEHLFDLAAMSGQEHVYHDHITLEQLCLHFGEVFLAAVQSVYQQDTNARLGSCHKLCFPCMNGMDSLPLIRFDKHVGYESNGMPVLYSLLFPGKSAIVPFVPNLSF